MFSGSSQLTTTAEYCFVVWTVLNDLITVRSAVVGSWKEPTNIWLTVTKIAFVGWALNFRARMLLKGAVCSCAVELISQLLIKLCVKLRWSLMSSYLSQQFNLFKLLSFIYAFVWAWLLCYKRIGLTRKKETREGTPHKVTKFFSKNPLRL